ncbi:MAG: c-type cytochrome [Verrucomicrobia bacterium]|nr:c-type cytochrome [Verrucomicrobiota bacterium]
MESARGFVHSRRVMNSNGPGGFPQLVLLAAGLMLVTPPSFAMAQHDDHPQGAKADKPVVFLDKSPVIVKFQLGRLSNEQLLLVDREDTHAKFAPVHEAIVARPGIAVKFKQDALAALAKINKSDVPTEILAGIRRLKPEDAKVLAELSRLLASQKPAELEKHQPDLETLAGGDGPASARQAAFAALIAIRPADALWTFADGKPGALANLLGGVPLVADGAKRAAFVARTLPLLKPGGDAVVRRAAISAAAVMGGHEAEVFNALAALAAAGIDAPDCARAALALPRDKWPEGQIKPFADALLVAARKVPEAQRTQDDFLDMTQLGVALAAKLPRDAGAPLATAFRGLGVNVLRLRTLHEQMFFDKVLLLAEAGKPIELVFENTDAMPHNFVLTLPGALDEIGAAAERMQPVPDAQGRLYVPVSPKILQATKMLNPSESARLRFTAPSAPGDYPYVCTFPGHWQRMRGVLRVVKDLDEHLAKAPEEPAAPVITEWKLADLEPDLPELARGRAFEKGRALFTTIGCVACHKVGKEGVDYGPELTGVFAKYKGDAKAVLSEILEPSKIIEPRYRPYEFKPVGNNEPFTGFLVKEEGDTLFVQTGPGANLIQKFAKKDIASRTPQPSSLMPAGLMNLMSREQILDLLAFLQSGGDPKQAASGGK